MQTGLIHGTGMAYLGGEMRVVAPVLEGDTIRVEVEIADKRETKKTDRGIVTYAHRVLNQRDEVVLEATLQRMIRRAERVTPSGARVGGLVHPPHGGRGQVRVDLRRADVGVAQHRLHGAKIRAALQQVAGEAVAQRMR